MQVDLTRRTQEFSYTTGLVALAASGTVRSTVNITADAAFVMVKRSCVVLDVADAFLVFAAGVAIPEPNHPADRITVQMRQSDNQGRPVTDAAVPLSSFAGTGRLPFILPTPLLCMPNSQLFLDFTNLVATAANVRVVFHGIKVYDLSVVEKTVLTS